jgi:hypothetical protein
VWQGAAGAACQLPHHNPLFSPSLSTPLILALGSRSRGLSPALRPRRCLTMQWPDRRPNDASDLVEVGAGDAFEVIRPLPRRNDTDSVAVISVKWRGVAECSRLNTIPSGRLGLRCQVRLTSSTMKSVRGDATPAVVASLSDMTLRVRAARTALMRALAPRPSSTVISAPPAFGRDVRGQWPPPEERDVPKTTPALPAGPSLCRSHR